MRRIIYKIKVLILASVLMFSEDDEDVSKWSKRLFGRDIIEEWHQRGNKYLTKPK